MARLPRGAPSWNYLVDVRAGVLDLNLGIAAVPGVDDAARTAGRPGSKQGNKLAYRSPAECVPLPSIEFLKLKIRRPTGSDRQIGRAGLR